jgi:hypothetical protein
MVVMLWLQVEEKSTEIECHGEDLKTDLLPLSLEFQELFTACHALSMVSSS